MNIETNLSTIQQLSINKQKENDLFVDVLKKKESKLIDKLVVELNENIAPKIDCTACGNCCKNLMINVEEDEANNASNALTLTRQAFDEKYLEKSESGRMIINTIPCHFLKENKCTIYANRFDGCREFPALHLPNIQQRLFTLFMHYQTCPIIFNVIEALKQELNFN